MSQMYENGYTKMHPVDIKAPASMLETVCGYSDEKFNKELRFALASGDISTVDAMRWLAALLARKIDETESE